MWGIKQSKKIKGSCKARGWQDLWPQAPEGLLPWVHETSCWPIWALRGGWLSSQLWKPQYSIFSILKLIQKYLIDWQLQVFMETYFKLDFISSNLQAKISSGFLGNIDLLFLQRHKLQAAHDIFATWVLAAAVRCPVDGVNYRGDPITLLWTCIC